MENTPLQTLLDERAASFSLKFGDVEHVDCAQENNSNCQAFSQLKERDRDSFLRGVRLGREEVIDVISRAKSYVPVEDNLISRFGHKLLEAILKETAALEAKEKEI